MSTLYPGGDYPVTPNLGLALWDMSFEMATNMVLIDTAVGSGSSSVQINGSVIANPNFNNTTPAAPAGKSNVLWQVSGSSVSAYVDSASVQVNGSVVSSPNFNGTLPAAPTAGIQAVWQSDVSGNISSYITIPSTLHVPATTTLAPNSGSTVTLQAPNDNSVLIAAPSMLSGDASLILSAGLAGLNGGIGGGVYLNDPNGGGIVLNTAAAVSVTDTVGSLWNGAAGGSQGAGTINALGLYVNGVAVVTGSGSSLWSGLGNATADLTLANAGFNTTFNQTSATNWTWANTTAATGSVSQSSPVLNINGTYWDGAASQIDSWTLQDVVANGTNGASTLAFTHSGTTGASGVQIPKLGIGTAPTANPVEILLPAVGSTSYFKLKGTGATFSTRLGSTFYGNQYDWFTNIVYNGSTFSHDDSTLTAWRMHHLVATSDGASEFGLDHWSAGSNTTTFPFSVLGTGAVKTPSNGVYAFGSANNATFSQTVDTGISRISANVVGVGNGTTGDFTGALKLGAITEDNATAATSGVSQSSPIYTLSGRYWDGAASQIDSWTLQDVVANGTNGISTFTFAHSGSSGSSVVLVPSLSVGVSTTGWQRGTSTNNTFASDFVRTYSNTNNTGWSHGVNSANIAVIASPNGHVAWTNNNNPSGSATTVGITNQTTTATQLNVYQNMYNRDTLGFLGFQGTPNGISIAALATPAAPTVTVAQGSGATTWGYKVVAKDGSGATIASSEGTVANNATLNGNSVPATNKVLITRVNGASSYDVYRTTVGTSPNTSGLIGNISDAGTTFQVLGASSTTVGAYFVNDFGSNSAVTTVFAPSGTTSQYNCTNLSIGNNNGCAGLWITIAGCVASNNNGRFFCLKSNSGQLFLINPSATAAAGQSGTATVAGDGTVPPSVGLNTAGGINLIPPTSAIPGGVAYSSGLITLGGYYFNGSGVGTDSWTIQNAIGPLTNDSSLLELLHSGTPGTAGVLIGNTSFTTAIANSPYLILGGSYEVSASLNTFAEDNWYFQNVIGAGANGTSTLNITHTGTSGVSKIKVPALSVTGILYDGTDAAGANTNVLTSTGTGTRWSAIGSLQGINVSTVAPQTGDTLRYNEWGDSKWDVCIGAPFVRGLYADIFNASILAFNAGTNPSIGTGGALARVAPTATEPVMQGNATAGTASTLVTCYISWQAAGVNPFAFGSVRRMSTRVQFLHTANVRYFLGLFSNAATPAVSTGTDTPNTHYAAFRYSAGTDTTIQAICGTATASLTVVDTGVAVDTTASHVFDIAYDGTNVNFFIDGVLKAQISTNLPSTSDTVQPSLMCDNKNTNNAVGWRFAWMVIAPR